MKGLQVSLVFGFLLTLFAVVANGFHFLGPYDVYKTRTARWPSTREAVGAAGSGTNENDFQNAPEAEQNYYKIISHLNDIGRRRR